MLYVKYISIKLEKISRRLFGDLLPMEPHCLRNPVKCRWTWQLAAWHDGGATSACTWTLALLYQPRLFHFFPSLRLGVLHLLPFLMLYYFACHQCNFTLTSLTSLLTGNKIIQYLPNELLYYMRSHVRTQYVLAIYLLLNQLVVFVKLTILMTRNLK